MEIYFKRLWHYRTDRHTANIPGAFCGRNPGFTDGANFTIAQGVPHFQNEELHGGRKIPLRGFNKQF